MSYRTYNIPMSAGKLTNLPVVGRYVRPLKSQGEMTLYLDGTEAGLIAQGIGVHIPEGVRSIGLVSPIAQTVMLAISDLPVDDGRLSFDSVVSVRNEYRSFDGDQFMVSGSVAGDGTDWATMLIKNPSGSGKRLIITSITVDAQGNVVAIYRGTGSPTLSRLTNSGACANKYLGKQTSVSTYEQGGNFFPPAGAENVMYLVNDTNKTPFVKDFQNSPLVIPDGGYFYMGIISSLGELHYFVEFEES